MNLDRFIGWRLDEARKTLAEEDATRSLEVITTETVAPPRKIDSEIDRFGQWRVLRVQFVEGRIELLIAREQIVD